MAAIYARAVPTFSPRLRGFSEPVAGSAIFPVAHDGTYCSGSLRTVDPGRTADHGPRTPDDAQDRGPWIGPRTQDRGLLSRSRRSPKMALIAQAHYAPWTQDGPRTKDPGPRTTRRTADHGQDLGRRTADCYRLPNLPPRCQTTSASPYVLHCTRTPSAPPVSTTLSTRPPRATS